MQAININEPTAARRRIYFRLVDETDGKTAETGQTFSGTDIKVSKAGGSEASFAGSATELAGGLYYYQFTTGEIDTLGAIYIRVVKSGCLDFVGVAQVVEDGPRATVVSDGSNTSSTFKTDLTSSTTDFYKDMLLVILDGSLQYQVKKVTGYNGSTKFVTVGPAFTAAPSAGVAFRLVNQ